MLVVSRSSVPMVKVAGLQRAARFAGETFGYEELGSYEVQHRRPVLSASRMIWLAVAASALLGLIALALR